MNFNFGESKWWTPYSFVGLNLRVPISAYYKDRSQIDSQLLKAKQLDLQIQQRKSDIQYQYESAMADLQNASANVTQTGESYNLAKRIYALQEAQVTSGSLLYSNLLDTERSLSLAEQNYIRAVYDLMVAQINFQRAVGEL
jgi:outer membrane protein TolC